MLVKMDEVKTFLEGINLGCYVQIFEEKGWDDIETVLLMSEHDIKECIQKPGHAKRLYHKIQQILSEREDESNAENIQHTKEIILTKAKLCSSVLAGERGSLADGPTTSEALQRNESNLDKGDTQPDIALLQADLSKIKCDTVAKSEADVLDVQEKTHEDNSKVDSLTCPANNNLIGSSEDRMLVQMRETCEDNCRKEEHIIKPIQDLVLSAALRTQLIQREPLSVCDEKMRTYHGDMPLCTYVSESENVTIAKNVNVQQVTKHYGSGQSKYKDQIQSVLDSIEEKHQKLIIETRAYAEVNYILDDRYWAVITGNAGEGKTTLGYHLLRQHRQQGYEPLIITSVDDWKNLVDGKRREKQFVLIDDIFGTISVDERKVNEWASMFEMIDKLLTERNGDLKVACTIRTLIYSEVETKLRRFKCFQKMRILDISGKQFALEENEKSKMLEKYMKYYSIEPDLPEIGQINANKNCHGFPHCLEMFCTNISLRQKGFKFFLNPIGMLEDEFENLYESDKPKFCALVMLVAAAVENIQVSIYSEVEEKKSLFEIAVKLSESPPMTTLQDINNAFRHLKNTYIKINDDDVISFRHPSFHEMVSIIVTRRNPVVAIEYLDIKFLTFKTKSHGYQQDMSEVVVPLPKTCNKYLVKRFSQALIHAYVDVLKHNAWDDTDFIKLWIRHVTQCQPDDENKECILLKLLNLEYVDYLMLHNNMLLSLFALNKHEKIISTIVQHENLKDFWSTRWGILQLSRTLVSASSCDCSVKLLECLLQHGADINYFISTYGNSDIVIRNALYYAVENNNTENAKTLLKFGASDFIISDTDSVFAHAVSHKNMDIIMLLLNYLETYQSYDAAENHLHKQYFLYGENYSQILSGCLKKFEKFDIFKTPIDNTALMKDILCCLNNTGITMSDEQLFDMVSSTKSTENLEQVVEMLNSIGYSFDNMWKSCDFCSLLKSQSNPTESLDIFQRHGLELDSRDVFGNTILHYIPYGNMQENDHALLAYLLRKGVSVDKPDENGTIPVQLALRYFKPMSDCSESILKLIELSDVSKTKDKSGKTCFHYLAMSRSPFSKGVLECLIDLLLKKGCAINEMDNAGIVPLFFCNLGLLEMFIEKGANPKLTDSERRSVAMTIIKRNEHNVLDMISVLSESGLDLTMPDVNERNLVHYVGDSIYSNTVKEHLFALLLSKGVNINTKDIKNVTPLMNVVHNSKSTVAFVHFTIQNGASVMDKDSDGLTVFHHCIHSAIPEKEKLAIVEYLLKKDVQIDMTNLLTYAMEYAEESIIYCLLHSFTLAVDTVFNIGKTCIYSACKISIYTLYLLLRSKYGLEFMNLLGKDDEFQKALFRNICMSFPVEVCNVSEVFPKGIDIHWLNTVNRVPCEIFSSSETFRNIIICQNESSLEYNLAKTGQFHLLNFLLHDSKLWVVSENELPEILNSLALCTDEDTTEMLLTTLFSAKENCIIYKSIKYITLKHWCKQPNLQPSCIRLLLLHGDTDTVDEKNESLVFCVIQHFIQYQLNPNDYTELVKDLIKFNFKCDVPDKDGLTPLMFLILNSDTRSEALIDLLISKSEYLSQKDNVGCNIFHFIVMSGMSDRNKATLVRNLLEKDVRIIKNNHGDSDIKKHDLIDLLQNSIRNVSTEFHRYGHHFKEIFEESKLNAKTDVDITGSTFLAQSARWLSSELVSYFIQKGSDLNKSDILGFSPIHRIILSSSLIACSVSKCVYFDKCAYVEAAAELQRLGLPEVEYKHKIEIHRGCLKGVNDALDCLTMLLEHGADPNAMDINGRTPLHYCAESLRFDAFICPAMSILISYGADVDREDFNGKTPLMLCLQLGKSKYRRLNILIKASASFFSEDYTCNDMFHYAHKGIGNILLCFLEEWEENILHTPFNTLSFPA